MSTPLLTTKLYIPPVRPGLVPRPHLIERLNAGLVGPGGLQKGLGFARKLTLISAPAGFGKTTLLSAWVADFATIQNQGSKIRVAWLSLEESDNDPTRFLAYFIAALQKIEENIGTGTLSTLQSPRSPPMEALLTTLVNEVSAIPDRFVLVLDDYHLITAQSIHDALAFLLDHLPAQMHLVIATRADPPLPLTRLRGRGRLTELRQADLRFMPDETARFFAQVMHLELAAGDVATLASRTEGWITGLQMAAIALQSLRLPQSVRLPQAQASLEEQGAEHTTSFIQAFAGTNRYILDYLVEEVLQRQPERIQTFLLQTSILDRLTGPLCDAVAEMGKSANQQIGTSARLQADDLQIRRFADLRFADLSGQEALEYLERNNLFVVPLDDERRWYRYHRLFADLLQHRLHQAHPNLVPTLHGRASAWYEQNGLMAAAIGHALSAGDFEWAAHLIEQEAEGTLMRSEVATLLHWVDRLPEELVRTRPSLCAYHAWALLLSGRPIDTVESRLQSLGGDIDMISKAVPLRALIATMKGQISRAAELSRQALEQLPQDDHFLRSIAAWLLGISAMADGDFVGGSQALGELARMSQEAGNVMTAVMTLCGLAEVHVAQGQLCTARDLYQRALELAIDERGQPLPIAGMALMGLGELAREWNDLEVAARYLTEGIERIRLWAEMGTLDGYIPLAHVRQAQGDVDGAHDAIQEALRVAVKFDATELDDILVAAHQAYLWVAQGDLEAARGWVEEQGLSVDVCLADLEKKYAGRSSPNSQRRTFEYFVFARMLLAHEQPAKALKLLEPLLVVLERRGLDGRAIQAQILKALALQAQGQVDRATSALDRALSLAEPEGYVRIFVDQGEPMADLLRQTAARGIAVDYASKLLAAFEPQAPRLKVSDSEPPQANLKPETRLVEPLSERELEVLQLLTTSLSSTDIAQELFISTNTARSHIRSIYNKLDVHSRYEAIARAKELDLLSGNK